MEFEKSSPQNTSTLTKGTVKSCIGCLFVRYWELDSLEINQTASAETLVAPFEVSATANRLGSLGVDLGTRKADEPEGGGRLSPVPRLSW